MEAKTFRHIEDGSEYNALLPGARLTDTTKKRGATLKDTMKLIPEVVKLCCWQTKKLSRVLKGKSVTDTCCNIWNFLYRHIRFNKDKDNTEQIRSPARSWHDRRSGIDCDCFTVFISCILTDLGIPHTLRITKYREPRFQHIYPIVPIGDGKYITIDCVTDKFNYEEPYSEKEDTPMDLQFLEGFDDTENEPLGKKGWFKKFTHNALHAFNRVNPATVLLRNGVLASMKINMFKVAQRLKYAYLSEAEAKKKGMDMNKWNQLVRVKNKLENIFFGAGGLPGNFKKAILSGEGNRNHDVSGLGSAMDMPLHKLLGKEIFESENHVEGLGELGVVLTATAIASATAVIAAISEAIKKIGNPFKSNDSSSGDFKTTAEEDAATADASKNLTADQRSMMDSASASSPANSGTAANNGGGGSGNGGDGEPPEGFWAKNKKWLKPALFGAAGLGALFGGYKLLAKKKPKKENLSGIKKKKPRDKLKAIDIT